MTPLSRVPPVAMDAKMVAAVWAWINFTWFASAFDNDDWLFRI
jgi:hypothetical protein